jgi:hypothetical protein
MGPEKAETTVRAEYDFDYSKARPNRFMNKRYIGDGVYVEVDEQGVILTTEDGVSTTNRIVLEPEVWAALMQFVRLVEGSFDLWKAK